MWSFLVLQAGRITDEVSFGEAWVHIATPLKSVSLINLAAWIRFWDASVDGLSDDLCAPTKITGMLIFSNINESAAEV